MSANRGHHRQLNNYQKYKSVELGDQLLPAYLPQPWSSATSLNSPTSFTSSASFTSFINCLPSPTYISSFNSPADFTSFRSFTSITIFTYPPANVSMNMVIIVSLMPDYQHKCNHDPQDGLWQTALLCQARGLERHWQRFSLSLSLFYILSILKAH